MSLHYNLNKQKKFRELFCENFAAMGVEEEAKPGKSPGGGSAAKNSGESNSSSTDKKQPSTAKEVKEKHKR